VNIVGQVFAFLLINTFLGLIIGLLIETFYNLEFSKIMNFVFDRMEKVFGMNDKKGIDQAPPFIAFLNIVLPCLILFLVFYVVRFVYLFLLKFPLEIVRETYYLHTKKKKG
jgi:hypothetical protein